MVNKHLLVIGEVMKLAMEQLVRLMDYSKNVLGCASCNCDGHPVLPSEERLKRDKMTVVW